MKSLQNERNGGRKESVLSRGSFISSVYAFRVSKQRPGQWMTSMLCTQSQDIIILLEV